MSLESLPNPTGITAFEEPSPETKERARRAELSGEGYDPSDPVKSFDKLYEDALIEPPKSGLLLRASRDIPGFGQVAIEKGLVFTHYDHKKGTGKPLLLSE